MLANETITPAGTPTDPQIMRERATGRAETDATTPEEDLPKGEIKKKGAKDAAVQPVSTGTPAAKAIAPTVTAPIPAKK